MRRKFEKTMTYSRHDMSAGPPSLDTSCRRVYGVDTCRLWSSARQSLTARYEDEASRLSQKLMAALFEVGVNTINYHLKEVYESGDIAPEATIRECRIVQTDERAS